MKILLLEGAGMTGTKINDVINCRLRTRFMNDEGRVIYFELTGTDTSNHYSKKSSDYKMKAFISHCFYDDVEEDSRSNYSKELSKLEHEHFEYTLGNILNFVNVNMKCSFNNIAVDETINVHKNNSCLC